MIGQKLRLITSGCSWVSDDIDRSWWPRVSRSVARATAMGAAIGLGRGLALRSWMTHLAIQSGEEGEL